MKFPLEWIGEHVSVLRTRDLDDLLDKLDEKGATRPSGRSGGAPSTSPVSVDELAALLTRSGMVVDSVEGSGDDIAFEIDVPTNRPDAMNVRGIAREIAAATGARLAPLPEGGAERSSEPPADARVEIADGDLCGRYCARVIRGVSVGPSPEWLARRLRNAGLNVLNNLVDVTNYVLWELGHPLHAFDLARLEGRRIVVRRARPGEKLTTLDGIERTLDAEMLVIADARRPVALAGIMGGAESMISSSTTELLLESAWFSPSSVRRTRRRLGLSTDASYRFERGADREAAAVAIDRAATLISELAGGRVAPGLLDVQGSQPPAPRRIRLRLARAGRLLGMDVEREAAGKALEALGFGVSPGEGSLDVTLPSWRQDVLGEADLVEEVGRIIGYEGIPEHHPALPGYGALHRSAHAREDELRASLLASGFTEVMSLPFVAADEDAVGRLDGQETLRLTNPMAEGQECLRSTLLPGLARILKNNLRHGVRDAAVFEIGRAFHRPASGIQSSPQGGKEDPGVAPGRSGYPGRLEPLLCGLAMTGLARARHWSEPPREATLHDLKGAVEEAAERLGIPVSFTPSASSVFSRGTGIEVIAEGRPVGRMGEVAATAAGKLGVKARVHFAEMSLTDLLSIEGAPPRFTPLPRFPSASRDLALVVPHGVLWRDIEDEIRASGGRIVSEVQLFDRYTGGSIGEGRLSLAVSIVFQDPDRTLSAEDVQAAEQAVLAALRARLGITLRQ